MSEHETDMMKLINQIAENIRWLRQRAEERDRQSNVKQRCVNVLSDTPHSSRFDLSMSAYGRRTDMADWLPDVRL